jgi:hypothetical protein
MVLTLCDSSLYWHLLNLDFLMNSGCYFLIGRDRGQSIFGLGC